MMTSYHGRQFRPVETQDESDTDGQTVFKYEQTQNLLTGTYSGGAIRYGHLIGLVDNEGRIDMRYHHMTNDGELKTGLCRSVPELLETGKIRLHESWQWTSGDKAKGQTTLEEL